MFSNLSRSTKILIAVNLVLVFVIIIVFALLFLSKPSRNSPAGKNIAVTDSQKKMSDEEKKAAHEKLDETVREILGEDAKTYSIYIFRPGVDDEPFIFQSRKMQPASMIKMFILAKAMQDVKDQKLSLDENLTLTRENIVGGAGSLAGYGLGAQIPVRLALELMISQSDNTATNLLADRLGMQNIKDYISSHGYTDTEFNHKMMQGGNKILNYTSVKDLGELFRKIYNSECVDSYHDRMMTEYLLKQEDRECLPAVLPLWNVAHKTGEAATVYGDTIYCDGGICYGSTGDFIIVMMNDSFVGRAETIEKMQLVALSVASGKTVTQLPNLPGKK